MRSSSRKGAGYRWSWIQLVHAAYTTTTPRAGAWRTARTAWIAAVPPVISLRPSRPTPYPRLGHHHHRTWASFSNLFDNNNNESSRFSPTARATTPPMSTTTDPSIPSSPNRVIRAVRKRAPQDLPACGQHLREGGLVAFPTETVYGLGGHALQAAALAQIFQAKERPLTDPLIVHVLDPSDAWRLWQATADAEATPGLGPEWMERTILQTLTQHFWPGPLTLVARAVHTISGGRTLPSELHAGTGYVACRAPAQTTARALLQAAGVPLAAPSANKFGHVSPTTAQHVWQDLQYENVWILQQEDEEEEEAGQDHVDDDQKEKGVYSVSPPSSHREKVPRSTSCQVGVESTVLKVEIVPSDLSSDDDNDDSGSRALLTLLRQGAVSLEQLRDCLETQTAIPPHRVIWRSQWKATTPDDVATVAPGQSVRHYSPHIPSYVVSATAYQRTLCLSEEARPPAWLAQAVVVDYGQQLAAWQPQVAAYVDLSPTGQSSEAAQALFGTLRWAEQVAGAQCILFPDLPVSTDALTLALKDRLTRAASGVVLDDLSQARV